MRNQNLKKKNEYTKAVNETKSEKENIIKSTLRIMSCGFC